MKQVLNPSGEVVGLEMTRKAFFATHADFRNKPGRKGVPYRLALCPKHGTVSVPVTFVPEGGTK